MSCHDLREFLGRLEALGELQTIAAPVSPLLEIAAITDRVCKGAAANRALLFAQVDGCRFRVATNLFGSDKRVAAALGVEQLSALTARFDTLLAASSGMTAAEKLAALPATQAGQAAVPVVTSGATAAQFHPLPVGEPSVHLLLSLIKLHLARTPWVKCCPLWQIGR